MQYQNDRYSVQQMQYAVELSAHLPQPLQVGYSRLKLLSLTMDNEWIPTTKESLSLAQKIFSNGSIPDQQSDNTFDNKLKKIQSQAKEASKEFTRYMKKTRDIRIASFCLFVIIPISTPLLITTAYRATKVPQKFINLQSSLNQLFIADSDILQLQQINNLKIYSALDSIVGLQSCSSPSCSIYIDFPQSILLSQNEVPVAAVVHQQNPIFLISQNQENLQENDEKKAIPSAPHER